MGKHYRDPDDKPVLSDSIIDCQSSLVLTAAERMHSLYAMQKPNNLITNEPSYLVFYLNRGACKRNVDTHNDGRINSINNGNKRKARLLVYTAEECLAYCQSKGWLTKGEVNE